MLSVKNREKYHHFRNGKKIVILIFDNYVSLVFVIGKST